MEKDWLSYDITKLAICIKFLEEAKKTLNDVDDTDDFYAEIHNLKEKINDFKLQKETKLYWTVLNCDEGGWTVMEEQKYTEIIKRYTYEQLVYERAILEKEKANLYIRDKELSAEFKRRLEDK